jgi:Glycosyl hydrolase family 26
MQTLIVIAGLAVVFYCIPSVPRVVRGLRAWFTRKRLGVAALVAGAAATVAIAGYVVVAVKPGLLYGSTAGGARSAAGQSGGAQAATQVPLGVFTSAENDSWSSVAEFGHQAGQPVRYVLAYLDGPEPFPIELGAAAEQHDAELILQLSPFMSMDQVLAGQYDGYLSSLATQIRLYGQNVILSWAPEANGNWYQWGYSHTAPTTYLDAWAHVMREFRTLSNVTWMETLNRSYQGSGPIADYLVPGVSMVGIDAYYEYRDASFDNVLAPTIAQIRGLTNAPIMISETGVGEVNGQAHSIPDLVRGARADHVAALVYFDANQQVAGVHHQHWALTSAGAAALRSSLAGGGGPAEAGTGAEGAARSPGAAPGAKRQPAGYFPGRKVSRIGPGAELPRGG